MLTPLDENKNNLQQDFQNMNVNLYCKWFKLKVNTRNIYTTILVANQIWLYLFIVNMTKTKKRNLHSEKLIKSSIT